MKNFLIYILIMVACAQITLAQVNLQCPPCLPVKGCDKCWASVAEAEANNCSASAARVASDEINQDITEDEHAPLANAIVYPNPSYDGIFTIESGVELNGKILIINASGKIIDEYAVESSKIFRFSRNLDKGLYFMMFENRLGETSSRLLLVK